MAKHNKALRDVDAPFYSYWQALYLSFFSRRLYVDVGKRWKGYGILYLLLLMFIVTLPFALRVTLDFNRFFDYQILEPMQKLPKFYVQNGKVSLDKPMPYLIKNSKGDVVFIIDTTGAITRIDDRYPHLSVLVTANQIIYRLPTPQFFFASANKKQESPIYIQELSKGMNEVFSGEELSKSSGIERLKILSDATIYPTIVLMFTIIYLAFFLVFALMGQFVAKLFMKFSLTYKQSCRLLIVASTPQITALVIFLTLNWVFYGFGFFLIVLFAAYFSFAVLSLKRESHKLVVS